MNKNKVISLLLIGCMAMPMTGCGHFNFNIFKDKDKNTKTELPELNNGIDNWNQDQQSNSRVDQAYEYYKSQLTPYEDENTKYEKDGTGIGMTLYLANSAAISPGNEQKLAEGILDLIKESNNNRKIMDMNGYTDVQFFHKIIYNGKVIIEERNGQLITFDTGNSDFDNAVLALLNKGTDNLTSDNKESNESIKKKDNTFKKQTEKKQEEKTLKCNNCGKSYKKSQSDAAKPDKYCSSECNTEADRLQRKKEEEEAEKREQTKKKYYCKDCGTEISKSQYNNHGGRCSSCARTHDKESKPEYICNYCGKAYTLDESDAWDPYSFCSKACSMEWEEQQYKAWEEENEPTDFDDRHLQEQNE